VSNSINRDVDNMERDLKGYPDLKQENNYNDMLDYNHEIQLEQAKNIVEFHLHLDKVKKEILIAKLRFNELIDEVLDLYPQSIKDEFLLGEEL